MSRRFAVILLAALLGAIEVARAGSTEPELAIADVIPTQRGQVVTLVVTANYDHANALRLGYPVAVVVTQGTQRAQFFLDGRSTLSVGGGPAMPLPAARGVVAIAPTAITVALPPDFTAARAATVALEADFSRTALHSNSVEVSW